MCPLSCLWSVKRSSRPCAARGVTWLLRLCWISWGMCQKAVLNAGIHSVICPQPLRCRCTTRLSWSPQTRARPMLIASLQTSFRSSEKSKRAVSQHCAGSLGRSMHEASQAREAHPGRKLPSPTFSSGRRTLHHHQQQSEGKSLWRRLRVLRALGSLDTVKARPATTRLASKPWRPLGTARAAVQFLVALRASGRYRTL